MRKISLLNGWVQVCPNIVNYVERDKDGIHLYYSMNKPWALYLGKRVVYRKNEKMSHLSQAWEDKPEVLKSLLYQLNAYLSKLPKERFILPVKGKKLSLIYEEALILKQEIEWLQMKFQHNLAR
jgi:hypothetical protein